MKIYLVFLTAIFSFLLCLPVFADESDDWSTIMKDYSSNSDFGKIISTPEYKKAVETRENFAKKAKKNKKNKKSKVQEEISEEKVKLDMPDSSQPLLTLPIDVYYKNTIIKQGFYLVNSIHSGENYFLGLNQGNDVQIALIEAKLTTLPNKINMPKSVSFEKIDDKKIKIIYTENDSLLESVLWIY